VHPHQLVGQQLLWYHKARTASERYTANGLQLLPALLALVAADSQGSQQSANQTLQWLKACLQLVVWPC
jgi:hypothetical protein